MGLITDYYGNLGKLVAAPEPRVPTRDSQNALGRKQFDPNKASIAEAIMSMTPILGDVLSAKDTAASLSEGNYGEAALNGVGLLPFVPGLAGMVKKSGDAAKFLEYNGKPLPLFHGTDQTFDRFRDGQPIYFTPREDYSYIKNSPIVIEANVDMKNPYRPANKSEIEQIRSNPELMAELMGKGHDGMIWSKDDDIMRGASGWGDDYPQVVAFSPDQVKWINANRKGK